MKNFFPLLVLIILVASSPVYGIDFSAYLTSRYKLQFVEELPGQVENRILIISTRNFVPEANYKLKRGVQPKYGMYLFIAGSIGDSAFAMPLRSMEEASPFLPGYRDFLVYVDGHGKNFDQILERGFELTGRFSLNLVVFDWPTDYLALRKTAYAADDVAASFVIAMREFSILHEKYFPSSAVSAIFHSMGNRIIKAVSGKRLLQYMPDELFSNLVLNASAVRQGNHAKWVEKLDIQKRIYITINHNDRTLQGAKLLRLSDQLGLGYRRKRAGNAFYVNFSEVVTTEHNLFLGKTEAEKNNQFIYSFYQQALHGKEVNFGNETTYQILSPSEISLRFSFR